ncbi:MAG: hypothetical protein M3O20_15135 [Acidobacteriota bacterium]|nr:hypothetical protein [Acidobacteriota bacterium]
MTIREFGAKAHASGNDRGWSKTVREVDGQAPGVVHVLNGHALTETGRLLLQRANGAH